MITIHLSLPFDKVLNKNKERLELNSVKELLIEPHVPKVSVKVYSPINFFFGLIIEYHSFQLSETVLYIQIQTL